MDFARRVWLFQLLKPEELNSVNDAVNLRVSYVSTTEHALMWLHRQEGKLHYLLTVWLDTFLCFHLE